MWSNSHTCDSSGSPHTMPCMSLVMNQFGAYSSSDTLSRYIQKKVSTPRKRISQCLSQAFTIITVDNIDFLHSYARLYKGSSWHGTTIQAVQPLPSLSIHTQADVHPHSTPQSISNTHNLVPSDQIESPLAIGLSGSANSQATLGLNIQLIRDIRVNASSENDLDLRTVGESSYGGNTNITRSLHPKQADGNAEITYRCALNRKKRDRSSPFQSPKQITRSPAPKKRRRPHTGTEQPTEQVESNPTSSYQFVHTCTENTSMTKNVSDFLLNDQETSALNEFHEEIHT